MARYSAGGQERWTEAEKASTEDPVAGEIARRVVLFERTAMEPPSIRSEGISISAGTSQANGRPMPDGMTQLNMRVPHADSSSGDAAIVSRSDS